MHRCCLQHQRDRVCLIDCQQLGCLLMQHALPDGSSVTVLPSARHLQVPVSP